MVRPAGTAIGTLFVLSFGIALIWLAAPRTVAYATMAQDAFVIDSLARGENVPPERALAAISGRERALRWFDLADGWNDIGALYLMLARRPGLDTKARRALLDRSIRSFSTGLAQAPARPFAWLQLAQARHSRNPADPSVFPAALHLSYVTAPMESRIVSQRVRLGFAARAVLPKETGDRIADDVRLWATHDPATLAAWTRPQFALPWVRDALSGRPMLERDFLAAYLRLPAR